MSSTICHWPLVQLCCSPCVIKKKEKKRGSDHCVKGERERTEIIVPNGWAAASGRWFSDSPSLRTVYLSICRRRDGRWPTTVRLSVIVITRSRKSASYFDRRAAILSNPSHTLRVTPCHPSFEFARTEPAAPQRHTTARDIGSPSVLTELIVRLFVLGRKASAS